MSDNKEILVVASKIKKYIKQKSNFNSSNSMLGALSNKVRELCDSAIENARNNKRKTVKDKDIN